MKAIRFVGIEQPAQIADVPAPRPGFGEVVVAVEAAGLENPSVLARESYSKQCPANRRRPHRRSTKKARRPARSTLSLRFRSS